MPSGLRKLAAAGVGVDVWVMRLPVSRLACLTRQSTEPAPGAGQAGRAPLASRCPRRAPTAPPPAPARPGLPPSPPVPHAGTHRTSRLAQATVTAMQDSGGVEDQEVADLQNLVERTRAAAAPGPA